MLHDGSELCYVATVQHGADLLGKYLSKTGEGIRGFARKSGLPASQVCRYVQKKITPGVRAAFRIEDVTGRAVPARSWANGR